MKRSRKVLSWIAGIVLASVVVMLIGEQDCTLLHCADITLSL